MVNMKNRIKIIVAGVVAVAAMIAYKLWWDENEKKRPKRSGDSDEEETNRWN